MRAIYTFFVLVLSTALASGEVEKVIRGTKRSSGERYHIQDPEEMDGKYQLKDMNSAFLMPIPPVRNTMARKRAIRTSCWFQYNTMCPRNLFSQRSLSEQEASSSGFFHTDSNTDTDSDFIDSRITQRAVLQALGF